MANAKISNYFDLLA